MKQNRRRSSAQSLFVLGSGGGVHGSDRQLHRGSYQAPRMPGGSERFDLVNVYALCWTPKPLAFGFGVAQPGPHALSDQISLALGYGSEDRKNQLSSGCV